MPHMIMYIWVDYRIFGDGGVVVQAGYIVSVNMTCTARNVPIIDSVLTNCYFYGEVYVCKFLRIFYLSKKKKILKEGRCVAK